MHCIMAQCRLCDFLIDQSLHFDEANFYSQSYGSLFEQLTT